MHTFLKLWEEDHRTVIFVTHDVDEALVLGEDIFVFSKPPVKVKKYFSNELSIDQKYMSDPSFFQMKKKIMDHLD
jgi:ABC-type nitrate/sulfonate/bicarbonate transport system ATPase subunit